MSSRPHSSGGTWSFKKTQQSYTTLEAGKQQNFSWYFMSPPQKKKKHQKDPFYPLELSRGYSHAGKLVNNPSRNKTVLSIFSKFSPNFGLVIQPTVARSLFPFDRLQQLSSRDDIKNSIHFNFL